MEEHEIEIMESCQLSCHAEQQEVAPDQGARFGTGWTTAAVWGGRISEWEPPAAS